MSDNPKKNTHDTAPSPRIEQEVEETKQFFNIEKGVQDIKDKFGITEKQAFFCWFVSLGRTPIEAAKMVYNYSHDSNARSAAGNLMSTWKIKEVLAYLNNDQVVERTMHDLKLWWINWGREGMTDDDYSPSVKTSIWKTLAPLIFEDKMPSEARSMEKNLNQLKEMFAVSEAAKVRGIDAYKKPEEEEDGEGDKQTH